MEQFIVYYDWGILNVFHIIPVMYVICFFRFWNLFNESVIFRHKKRLDSKITQ